MFISPSFQMSLSPPYETVISVRFADCFHINIRVLNWLAMVEVDLYQASAKWPKSRHVKNLLIGGELELQNGIEIGRSWYQRICRKMQEYSVKLQQPGSVGCLPKSDPLHQSILQSSKLSLDFSWVFLIRLILAVGCQFSKMSRIVGITKLTNEVFSTGLAIVTSGSFSSRIPTEPPARKELSFNEGSRT